MRISDWSSDVCSSDLDDGEWVERHDDVAVHVERADELGIARFLVGEKAPDQPFETSAARRGEPHFLRPFLEPEVEREGRDTRRNCAFGQERKAYPERIARLLQLAALPLSVGRGRGKRRSPDR